MSERNDRRRVQRTGGRLGRLEERREGGNLSAEGLERLSAKELARMNCSHAKKDDTGHCASCGE